MPNLRAKNESGKPIRFQTSIAPVKRYFRHSDAIRADLGVALRRIHRRAVSCGDVEDLCRLGREVALLQRAGVDLEVLQLLRRPDVGTSNFALSEGMGGQGPVLAHGSCLPNV